MTTSTTPATSNPLSRDSLHALVHAFYADVRRDAALAPVFDAAIGAHW